MKKQRMDIWPRRDVLRAGLALGAGACGWPVVAQPVKPRLTTITTGFAPGGSSDAIARILAEYLRGRHADTVIVEPKVGAGGRLAVEHVKNAPGDVTSLLVGPSGMMVLFPHIYKNLRYDPLVDITPVTPLAKFPFFFAISSMVPATVRTLPDFISGARPIRRMLPLVRLVPEPVRTFQGSCWAAAPA